MKLNELADNPGSTKKLMRVGRGVGSGARSERGSTSGFGNDSGGGGGGGGGDGGGDSDGGGEILP